MEKETNKTGNIEKQQIEFMKQITKTLKNIEERLGEIGETLVQLKD